MKIHAAVLLAGLSAGCAAQTTEAPRHRPVTWQQFCEQSWSVPQANAMAAARGAEGFELVAMYNGVLCYKRPAPESEPSAQRPFPRLDQVPTVRDPGF